jgi:hypothetical protein
MWSIPIVTGFNEFLKGIKQVFWKKKNQEVD